MRKNKNLTSILTLALTSGLLVGCSLGNQTNSSITNNNQTNSSVNSDSSFVNPGDYLGGGQVGEDIVVDDSLADEIISGAEDVISTDDSATDTDTSYDESATMIALNSTTVAITGTGASYSDGVVSITTAGTYVLSGKLTDGQIYVNVDGNVHLVLNGVDITSSKSAPIAIFGTKKKVITAVEGTTNTFTDSSTYSVFYNGDNDEPNATIFAKKALTINGAGTIVVNANYNNGIGTKNDLKILDTKVVVKAVNNGIKGNDSIVLKGAKVDVTSSEDGIKSDTEEEGKGYIYIEESSVDVTSTYDAIQSYNYLQIKSGTLNIVTGGGYNTPSNNSSSRPGDWGSTSSSDDSSAKGLKSDSSILIESGNISLNCYDDAIHSDGSIVVTGGDIVIRSGDDGMHADESLNINGGTIDIQACYEGVESAKITFNAGRVSVVSSDDGINAADGTTTQMGYANSNCYLHFNGGQVYVNAKGDGVDSNGGIVMNGGALYIDGPSDSGNGSLDTESGFIMKGGVLVATGSLGMVETPATNSTQYVVSYASSSNISANTQISVKDSSGETLLYFTPTKIYRSVIISCPDFEKGKTYTIYGDDTSLTSFTISSTITTVGSTTGGGFGGGGTGGRPWW